MAARFGLEMNATGVYVYKVVAQGPLDQAGLRHGDIITKSAIATSRTSMISVKP